MHKNEWKRKTRQFQRAAIFLFRSGHHSAAYYLAGLAVECALKVKICDAFLARSWPSKKLVTDAHTHELTVLVKLADLESDRITEAQRSPSFSLNWNVAKDWKVESRYQEWTQAQASNMVSAVTSRTGVLPWIRRHW